MTLNHTVRSQVLHNKLGYRCRDDFGPHELWLEKVFNSHVVVLCVLACASCNVANISLHRLLVARVVFSTPSRQVSFQICCATAVLISRSTDLTYGQTFVPPSYKIRISSKL